MTQNFFQFNGLLCFTAVYGSKAKVKLHFTKTRSSVKEKKDWIDDS